MLRITTLSGEEEVHLFVEGRLTRHTIGVLERECGHYLSREQAVRLDLSELTFADDAGTNALRRLERQGVLLGKRSTFLNWLLDQRGEKGDE